MKNKEQFAKWLNSLDVDHKIAKSWDKLDEKEKELYLEEASAYLATGPSEWPLAIVKRYFDGIVSFDEGSN